MSWMEPSASLRRLRISFVPEAELFQFEHQIAVDLQELAGERFAFEEVRNLRLDAFVAADDGGDRRGGRDGDEQRVAQARRSDARRGVRPSARCRAALDAPQIELKIALGCAGFGEGGMRAVLFGESRTRRRVRGSKSLPGCVSRAARASGASNGRRSWKKTSCRPMTPRPTGRQRAIRMRRRESIG